MAILIAFLIGLSIMAAAVWTVRLLQIPGPEEPDIDEVVEVEQTYMCTVCGLQLTVTYAQGDGFAAPKHCREEMEVVGSR